VPVFQRHSCRPSDQPATPSCRSVHPEVAVIQNWFEQIQFGIGRSPQRSGRVIAADIRAVCGLGVVLLLTGCGYNGLFGTHAPPPVVEKSATKAPDDYVIGSGDSLSIFVYRNPDLSEAGVAVRPDGRISTPLIEDIVAAGKTPTQLGREIEQRLSKYIQDPNVTVIVRGFVGPSDRQVRVIGEATDPIAIPYRDHMTLLDVMIATKGLTKYAAGNRAIIVRTDPDGKRQTIKVRLTDLIKYGDIGQNIEMSPGDTLIVPQSWF
jgi:polysaccharide export outer membrane protein